MTGRIVVHRPRRLQNSGERYLVEVDGRKVDEVRSGGSCTVEVPTGGCQRRWGWDAGTVKLAW